MKLRLWCMVPLLLAACRDEPTIVIKFEPADMTGAARAAVTDLAVPRELAAARDLGAPARQAAECKTAADCVVEPDGCCDCSSGGKQRAIAKAHAAASKKERAKRCGETTACVMVLSNDPTCFMRAGCVGGACVLVKKPDAK